MRGEWGVGSEVIGVKAVGVGMGWDGWVGGFVGRGGFGEYEGGWRIRGFALRSVPERACVPAW